jgi:ATP-dependent exoDNAse (exonuclease V) beta subunit
LALAAILRSPLGGISDNTLFALRCAPWIDEDDAQTHLHRRNLLRAVRRHRQVKFIDEDEHVALDRIATWIESMIARRNRYGITDLLRYAVESSELLTIIATNFDGAQRVANVEKLFRLAEQFEKSGHLIRDFVHYVEEFEAIGGREGEGQIDESANVVRLMTIHQAKGLEFPIVIVPDLHREPNRRESVFILDRHRGLTVRVPDGRGRSVRGRLFHELSRRNHWRCDFEDMRLLYVAATRAEDRLIFSGAVEQKRLENLENSALWIGWLWRALGLAPHTQSGMMTLADDTHVQITIDRDALSGTPVSTRSSETLERQFDPPHAASFPLLQRISPQPGTVLRRFTVTQLLNFQRCARQYYFDRMLKTPAVEERDVWNDAEVPEPPANLTATLKGAVIHRFCETFRAGDNVQTRLIASFREIVSQRQAELIGRPLDIDEVEAVRALLPLAQNYLSSEVYRRVSSVQLRNDSHRLNSAPQFPGLCSELRFRLRRRNGILTGTIDKLILTAARDGKGIDAEIIDFKTNRFPQSSRERSITTAASASVQSPDESTNHAAQGVLNFEAGTLATGMEENRATANVDRSLAERINITAADYQLQMQAYALALRELLPTEVDLNSLRATLHFIDPNIEVPIDASLLDSKTSSETVDEAMQTIAMHDSTLDADQFPPAPASHCRMCNFLEFCPAGQEWLRTGQ